MTASILIRADSVAEQFAWLGWKFGAHHDWSVESVTYGERDGVELETMTVVADGQPREMFENHLVFELLGRGTFHRRFLRRIYNVPKSFPNTLDGCMPDDGIRENLNTENDG